MSEIWKGLQGWSPLCVVYFPLATMSLWVTEIKPLQSILRGSSYILRNRGSNELFRNVSRRVMWHLYVQSLRCRLYSITDTKKESCNLWDRSPSCTPSPLPLSTFYCSHHSPLSIVSVNCADGHFGWLISRYHKEVCPGLS